MYFTKDHEWVVLDGDVATIGITTYAACQLGDVVFVETPVPGQTLIEGESFAVVESVKAASDVYAPLSGQVIEANGALSETPELVNAAPESDGWLARVRLSDPGQVAGLMDRAAYDAFVESL